MEEGFQRDFDEIGRVGWPTLRLIFYALPLCVFATLREIFSPFPQIHPIYLPPLTHRPRQSVITSESSSSLCSLIHSVSLFH
jgi:hypothetical protein